MQTASLVADPAGDTDEQTEVQTSVELRLRSGETMQHSARQRLAVVTQDSEEVIVGVALVKKEWFAEADCQLNLSFEGQSLLSRRRKVTVIIEPCFADGHGEWIGCKLTERCEGGIIKVDRMMRMATRRCAQDLRRGMGKGEG